MRYLPLTQDDRRAMLAKIGAPDVDALFRDVPKSAMIPLSVIDLPDTQGELEVERALSKLAGKNVAAGAAPFFCGAGANPMSETDPNLSASRRDRNPGLPLSSSLSSFAAVRIIVSSGRVRQCASTQPTTR